MARQKQSKTAAKTTSETGRTGGNLKSLVILLVVLDVLAAGAYGYLALVKRRQAETDLRAAENQLLRIKRDGETVATQADRLRREQAQDVKEPKDLILRVATAANIADKIRIADSVSRRLSGSRIYDEVTTSVSFREKEGYALRDLVKFLGAIEAQNPKVQIAKMVFGRRDEGEEGYWRPTQMVVRVFKPRSDQR